MKNKESVPGTCDFCKCELLLCILTDSFTHFSNIINVTTYEKQKIFENAFMIYGWISYM